MANVFADLPPVINATGAAVETTAFGAERTLTVAGAFNGLLVVEGSVDGGVTFAPLATFQRPGTRVITAAVSHMRVRSAGASGAFTPNIDVAGEAVGIRFGVIPAPLINAVGAPLDIAAFGEISTLIAGGTFGGALVVEVSGDGVDFVEVARITKARTQITLRLVADDIRIRSVGASGTFTPTISIAAANDSLPDVVANSFALTASDAAGTTDVYVDPTNGDDGQNGLTPATALLTVGEVYRKFPWQMLGTGRIVVHFINDTGARIDIEMNALLVGGGNEAFFNTYVYRGPQMVLITPATGPATAALDAVPAVEVGNRTRFDFTTAAPGWTVNDLVNAYIRVTRGDDLVFFELPISGNDADTVFVDTLGIVAELLPTDTVELVHPGIRIAGDAENQFVTTLLGRSSGFESFSGRPSTFERMSFFNLHTQGIYGVQYDRCRFEGNLGARLLAGSCGYVNCTTSIGIIMSGYSTFQPTSRPDVEGGVSPIDLTASIALQSVRRAGFGSPFGIFIGAFVPTSQRGQGVYLFGLPVSSYGASGPGVGVTAGSFFAMAPGIPLQGSGNGTNGLKCRWNSCARINGGLVTTITGATGSLALEAGPSIAYGNGVGEFEEVDGYNGNFTRKNEGTAAAPVGDASRITTAALA